MKKSLKFYIKKVIFLSKSIFIINDFLKFKKIDKEKIFSVNFLDIYPCLFEKTFTTKFDIHYVYHPAWAIRKVLEFAPEKHIDISSTLHFSSALSAFLLVEFYDYRPANLNLSNLKSGKADLNKLFFETESIESISCMHTIEHIGLGRYGDEFDPNGDKKAISELKRVLAKNGRLIFVTPMGKPKIEYNAHRIYSYEMIMELFSDLEILEFSLIPDNALETGIIFNADPKIVEKQNYACGLFVFVKK